jgi:hypothetical protein
VAQRRDCFEVFGQAAWGVYRRGWTAPSSKSRRTAVNDRLFPEFLSYQQKVADSIKTCRRINAFAVRTAQAASQYAVVNAPWLENDQ